MDFKVHLSRPDISAAEIDAVCAVLRSPTLSLGPKLDEFEQAFCKYVGRRRAVAVNSGTSGLYLAMKALGIGDGDEVITTPFTFIASATTIMMTGARPVFVDIDPVSLNMDAARIAGAVTERTKAVLPVEVFGNPAGMDAICDAAAVHDLVVVEDSCEGLGSELRGRKVGAFGKVSTFAFYPNKQITTGEGGMILTDDDAVADMCVSLRNQGRGKGGGWLAHERLGYNYRLSDINCALGIVQLSRLEEFVAKRRRVADMYFSRLGDDARLIMPQEPQDSVMSWFVYVVRLADRYTMEQRNTILQKMLGRGVQVSNYFPPVYLQPFMVDAYGWKEGDFPITDAVCRSTMALPFHNNISAGEIDFVCEQLRACLAEVD
ncbi:MAG: DegT/DnrJ/EryC1/StrS family aminotransferase [Phycisphaerae bacterium]|nr:DegT/DnrJ/EryC1/StrS family aminotransferase [Phycisphaerae bacterium]